MIEVDKVSYQVHSKKLLDQVTLALEPRQLTMLIGPNGAGKSTLLQIIAGALKPHQGRVSLAGKPLCRYHPQELAQKRAVLSQHSELMFPFSAVEVVMMGRSVYPESAKISRAIAEKMMIETDVVHLADANYLTLSGGERQRVHLARVLTQLYKNQENNQEKLLLLDEPFASLDLNHQYQLLKLLRRLTAQGYTILLAIHHLELALRYGDLVICLHQGQVYQQGSANEVINSTLIKTIFLVNANIENNRILME